MSKKGCKEAVLRGQNSSQNGQTVVPVNVPMYPHQLACYRHVMGLTRSAIFMEQGTGKTLVAIACIGKRYLDKQVQRVLIVAPLSVIPFWFEEFKRADYYYALGNLSRMKNKERKSILKQLKDRNGVEIAIINYESTWRFFLELEAWHPDLIICDESQKIKNHSAKQSKAMHRLGDAAPYRIVMTGTPITQSPLDVWSQYRFLSPSIFGYNYFRFRGHYAVMGGYGHHEVIKYRNIEDLAQRAHSIAYRVTKKEALDLPPTVDQDLLVDLSLKGRELYDKIAEEFGALLASGKTITIPIVLTQLLRLQQITGGFVKTDDGSIEQVDNSKLNELRELLVDLPNEKKIVIFARFIPEIAAIERLVKQVGRHSVTLSGATINRGLVVRQFQQDSHTTVFIAQIQTGGLGITLTAAETVIFYSTTFSFGDYDQARSRVHRIGQHKSINYIHLLQHDTIDEDVLKALREKRDVAEFIVDKLRRVAR